MLAKGRLRKAPSPPATMSQSAAAPAMWLASKKIVRKNFSVPERRA